MQSAARRLVVTIDWLIRCRTRRVKCDETKPSCLRCEKFGHKCDGYVQKEAKSPTMGRTTARTLVSKSPISPTSSRTVYPTILNDPSEEDMRAESSRRAVEEGPEGYRYHDTTSDSSFKLEEYSARQAYQ